MVSFSGLDIGDIGLGLLKAGYRMMPARLDFYPAVQRADEKTPNISWWHIPVVVRPSCYFRKRVIERAEVWAIPYLGDRQVGSGITLRWHSRDGCVTQITLEYGRPQLVPFIRREEGGGNEDGVGFITSDDWHKSDTKKLVLDNTVVNRWKIEVRGSEGGKFRSPHFYWINSPPKEASNGQFFVEILTGI